MKNKILSLILSLGMTALLVMQPCLAAAEQGDEASITFMAEVKENSVSAPDTNDNLTKPVPLFNDVNEIQVTFCGNLLGFSASACSTGVGFDTVATAGGFLGDSSAVRAVSEFINCFGFGSSTNSAGVCFCTCCSAGCLLCYGAGIICMCVLCFSSNSASFLVIPWDPT